MIVKERATEKWQQHHLRWLACRSQSRRDESNLRRHRDISKLHVCSKGKSRIASWVEQSDRLATLKVKRKIAASAVIDALNGAAKKLPQAVHSSLNPSPIGRVERNADSFFFTI